MARTLCLAALMPGVFALGSCKEKTNEQTLLLYGRASSAYAQGRFGEAASLLEEQRDYFPASLLRAKALYFDERGDEAEALLRRALRRHPGSGEASLFLVRILRERGEDGEAEKLTRSLLEDNPQDGRILRLASDLAARRGDTEEAAALLNRAVEASAETALVFVDRAKLRWASGNGAGALEDLRRAEILLPWNTPLGRGIGELRKTIGGRTAGEEP
jgi:tetratricopeptide (TPR) repeat protein